MLPKATAIDNPAYDRPRTSPGGAFNPKYATRIVAPAKASSPVKGESASFPIHVGDGDPSASSLPPEVAASLAENQRMYGLNPPIASSPAVASAKHVATPATLPKSKPLPQVGSPSRASVAAESEHSHSTPPSALRPQSAAPIRVANAAAEKVPDFLKNTDLHGLEPALSVRTRILLASHAMNRMNMQLDIAKSFAIAGYFPRVRFALLLLLLLLCSSCILADQRNLGSIWLTWLLRKESCRQAIFVFRAVDAMNKCVCARTVFVPDIFFSVL
jgi:hypothetical protein